MYIILDSILASLKQIFFSMEYTQRLVLTANKAELWNYELPVFKGVLQTCQGGGSKSDDPSWAQKRPDNGHRTRERIRHMVNSNPDLDKFLTLTFKRNLTSVPEANYEFKKFAQRLKYHYKKDLKYLTVLEFQKRGAVHFHSILSLPYVKKDLLDSLWGHGFIKINRLNSCNNIGAYVSKYIGKEPMLLKGKKKFFYSKNLQKPYETANKQVIDHMLSSGIISAETLVFEHSYESVPYGKISFEQHLLKPLPSIS